MSQSLLTLSAISATLFLQSHHSMIIGGGTIVCCQAKCKETPVSKKSSHNSRVKWVLWNSLQAVMLQCCCPASKILNYRQKDIRAWEGPKLYSSECVISTHTNMHVKNSLTHKERKWAMQPPLLFPSAHIHCDSSLCSRIAIRGTKPTLTSLTGCLLSFIPCDPANLEVMAGECYCWNISMKKGLWKAGGGVVWHQQALTGKRVTQG